MTFRRVAALLGLVAVLAAGPLAAGGYRISVVSVPAGCIAQCRRVTAQGGISLLPCGQGTAIAVEPACGLLFSLPPAGAGLQVAAFQVEHPERDVEFGFTYAPDRQPEIQDIGSPGAFADFLADLEREASVVFFGDPEGAVVNLAAALAADAERLRQQGVDVGRARIQAGPPAAPAAPGPAPEAPAPRGTRATTRAAAAGSGSSSRSRSPSGEVRPPADWRDRERREKENWEKQFKALKEFHEAKGRLPKVRELVVEKREMNQWYRSAVSFMRRGQLHPDRAALFAPFLARVEAAQAEGPEAPQGEAGGRMAGPEPSRGHPPDRPSRDGDQAPRKVPGRAQPLGGRPKRKAMEPARAVEAAPQVQGPGKRPRREASSPVPESYAATAAAPLPAGSEVAARALPAPAGLWDQPDPGSQARFEPAAPSGPGSPAGPGPGSGADGHGGSGVVLELQVMAWEALPLEADPGGCLPRELSLTFTDGASDLELGLVP
jgi:hypothetical protein